MHDATEGGILGGLYELSSACGLPVIVNKKRIHVPEECRAVCKIFGLDPLTTESEGTLIISCRRDAVDDVDAALAKERVEVFEVGRVGSSAEGKGLLASSPNSSGLTRLVPSPDGYWKAYADALGRGTKRQKSFQMNWMVKPSVGLRKTG